MIELVEVFGQLVTVVGNTARTVVLAGLFNCSAKLVELLNQLDFLLVERSICAQCCWNRNVFSLCLAQNRTDTCIGILDKRPRVAIEVDTLFRIEKHVLAGIYFQNEIFQCTQTNNASHILFLFLGHVLEFSEFIACLSGIINHRCNKVVSVYNSTLATLHLAIRQFNHTVREVHKLFTPLETKAVKQD